MHLRFFASLLASSTRLDHIFLLIWSPSLLVLLRPQFVNITLHHLTSCDFVRKQTNLLAPKPKSYEARSSISMLGVPTVGTHSWKRIQRGDSDPGGPNDTRRIITNQKQQIKYPCYRIRDTQSLKDKQIHDNVQFTFVQGYND